MKKNRILAFLMVLSLSIGCLSLNAAPRQKAVAATQLNQDAMSEVILAIKNKLEIGDEYTEFNYDFWEDGNEVNYSFYWNTKDYSKSVSVSCDQNARITYAYFGSQDKKRTIPDKTADEVIPDAEAAIARIAPETAGHLKKSRHYCSYYNSAYNYTFVREENGVEMPDNSVMVSVDYNTGELLNISVNWLYDVKIPSAKNLIGEEAAKEKIGGLVSMQLQYLLGWDKEDGKQKVYLAYVPSDSYVAVNAKTGKVYQERSYWDRSESEMAEDTAADYKNAESGTGASFNATLSEAEIAKIEDLENIISKDEAIELIRNNDALLIDENLNTFTAGLTNDNGRYVWSVSLRDARPTDYENNNYYRAYAYASVDASSKKIISFRSSVKGMYDMIGDEAGTIKLNYSKSACKKIFEDFAKSVDPEKFEQVKLASTEKTVAIYYDSVKDKYTYGGFAFRYDRYNEGIPFYANGINGSVDRITGKIFAYNANWYEDELPSSKGVIGEKKAFDAYMSSDGYKLNYEIVTDNNKNEQGIYERKYSVRLVYSTNIYPGNIDAFTGKQVDYSGSEYVPQNTAFSYDDIEGNKYERAIKLLADMSIGVAGGKFRPSDVITKSEFAELSDMMGRYTVVEKSELEGNKKLTREEAAKVAVTMLGYGKVAKLDIYKSLYEDASKISKGYEGYAALAGSLNLIDAKAGGKFKPSAGLTRGEAAQMLLNILKAGIEE